MVFLPFRAVGGHWEFENIAVGLFLEIAKIVGTVATVAVTVAYCSGYCSNGKNTIKTARICSKRLYWFLGLYKDISNSLEPPLNILQSPQIVIILFLLNLFIKYSFVSLRSQIVVISF